MNGLIQSQMDEELPGDPVAPDETAPHEQAEPPAMEQQEESQEGQGTAQTGQGDEELTPEQEEQFDRFVLAAQRVLYDSGYADDVVEALKRNPDSEALANLTYDLVAEIDGKSKGMVDDELIAPLAFEILGEIVEIAKAAGATISGREIASAAKAMISRYFTENGATPEEIEAVLGQIDLDGAGAEIDGGAEPQQPGMVNDAQAQQPAGAPL